MQGTSKINPCLDKLVVCVVDIHRLWVVVPLPPRSVSCVSLAARAFRVVRHCCGVHDTVRVLCAHGGGIQLLKGFPKHACSLP